MVDESGVGELTAVRLEVDGVMMKGTFGILVVGVVVGVVVALLIVVAMLVVVGLIVAVVVEGLLVVEVFHWE